MLDRVFGSNWTVIDHQAVTNAISYDIFFDATQPLYPTGALDLYNVRLGTGAMVLGSFNQGQRK